MLAMKVLFPLPRRVTHSPKYPPRQRCGVRGDSKLISASNYFVKVTGNSYYALALDINRHQCKQLIASSVI